MEKIINTNTNTNTDLYIQGGGFKLPKSLYSLSFPYIKPASKVLNFGCGLNFNFENYLNESVPADVTSVDILSPNSVPEHVKRFLIADIEEELSLDETFDTVTFFELIEHIDKTDILLQNCLKHLADTGYLIFSFPNLSSIYGRLELLFGFQPHVLEVSNIKGIFGAGIFGKLNIPREASLHHIRGITTRAMKDLLSYHGFEVVKVYGYSKYLNFVFSLFPNLAPTNVFVCKKKEF